MGNSKVDGEPCAVAVVVAGVSGWGGGMGEETGVRERLDRQGRQR